MLTLREMARLAQELDRETEALGWATAKVEAALKAGAEPAPELIAAFRDAVRLVALRHVEARGVLEDITRKRRASEGGETTVH